MGSTDYKFEGWMGLDPKAAEGNMVWQEFQPKAWEETDVDIRITHSGICGSDLHTLRSGWVCFACLREILARLLTMCRVLQCIPAVSATKFSELQ